MRKILVDSLQDSTGNRAGWRLIETQVASASATIDVINLTSEFFLYKFIWSAVAPATDAQSLWLRTSTNNGTSWDSGASDYAWSHHFVSMEVTEAHGENGDNFDSELAVSAAMGFATNEDGAFEVTCFNPSGTGYTKFKYEGTSERSDGVQRFYTGGGLRLSAAAVNGVRFLFASGNITSGILKVYGI